FAIASLIALTRAASVAGRLCTTCSSRLMSRADRVRFTVSPELDERWLELLGVRPLPACLVASARRAPTVSVGRKPWPLMRSVITCLRRLGASSVLIGLPAENFRANPLRPYAYFPR